MKYISVLILCVFNGLKGSTQCDDGWTEFQNSCYHVGREKENMVDAMKFCEFHSSVLVQINTPDEQTFLVNYLNSTKGSEFWTAGSDRRTENKWVWEPDQLPFQYTNWYPGQPNNNQGTENCVSLVRSWEYTWRDSFCYARFLYICEKNSTRPVSNPILG